MTSSYEVNDLHVTGSVSAISNLALESGGGDVTVSTISGRFRSIQGTFDFGSDTDLLLSDHVLVKATTDTSTFFRIEKSDGGGLLNVDASTQRFGFFIDVPLSAIDIAPQDGPVVIRDAAFTREDTAILQIEATNTPRGILIPRMDAATRDAIVSPATGLEIYNTDSNSFNFYNGTMWTAVGGGGSAAGPDGAVQLSDGAGTFTYDPMFVWRAIDNTLRVGINGEGAAISITDTSGGYLYWADEDVSFAHQLISGGPASEFLFHQQVTGQSIRLQADDGNIEITGNNLHLNLNERLTLENQGPGVILELKASNAGFVQFVNDDETTIYGVLTAGGDTGGSLNITAEAANLNLTSTVGVIQCTANGNTLVVMDEQVFHFRSDIQHNFQFETAGGAGIAFFDCDPVTGHLMIGTTPGSGGHGISFNDVGGDIPADDSAMIDVISTTKGFLPPRLTDTQRDAIVTPAAGLMIYNTDTNLINFYNGTVWLQLDVSPV